MFVLRFGCLYLFFFVPLRFRCRRYVFLSNRSAVNFNGARYQVVSPRSPTPFTGASHSRCVSRLPLDYVRAGDQVELGAIILRFGSGIGRWRLVFFSAAAAAAYRSVRPVVSARERPDAGP